MIRIAPSEERLGYAAAHDTTTGMPGIGWGAVPSKDAPRVGLMGGPHPLIAARGPAVALDAHLALTQFGERADRFRGLVACDDPSIPGGILPDSTHERFESPAVERLTCEMYGMDLSTQ